MSSRGHTIPDWEFGIGTLEEGAEPVDDGEMAVLLIRALYPPPDVDDPYAAWDAASPHHNRCNAGNVSAKTIAGHWIR